MNPTLGALTVVLLLVLNTAAQIPTSTPPDKSKTALREIPTYQPDLSEDTRYQSIHWGKSNDVVEARCDGDGRVFVWVGALGPFALTPDGVISFSKQKLTDIPNAFVTGLAGDLAVSDAGIYFRVSGVNDEDIDKRNEELTDEQGMTRVVQRREILRTHDFIAHFNSDGHYEGAIKNLPFRTYKLGVFPSGTLIAQGLDDNRRPRMALLDYRGQLLHYLELPKDLTEASEPLPTGGFKPCSGCESNTADAVLLSSSFTPARGRMLFFRPGLKSTRTYEIAESGAIRMIDLKLPPEYERHGFIPADTNWLASSFRSEKEGLVLFEIDPESGAAVRKYRVTDAQTAIACFSAGEFWGVRRDKREEKLRVVHGPAQPE